MKANDLLITRSSEAVDRVKVKGSVDSEPEQGCAQAGVQCRVVGDSEKDSHQRTQVQIKA